MSVGVTLAVVFGCIFTLALLATATYLLLRCHYALHRKLNRGLVEEAEAKLKKTIVKIEEESSSSLHKEQSIRQKLYDWEQKK